MLLISQYWITLCHLMLLNLLALIIPGPDFYTVMHRSLRDGKIGGIAATCGICASECCHFTYIILGAATFIQHHPWTLLLVKITGSLYLLYLGITLLKNTRNTDTPPPPYAQKNAAFITGFLCNITNPKAIIFYMSLFSVTVDSHTPLPILILYGLGLVATTFLWFMLVAMLMSTHTLQSKLHRASHYIEKGTGLILIVISIKLAMSLEY